MKGPFTMIRSKTESSLVGRGTNAGSGSSGSRNDPSDEAVQKDPTRGLNPIQSYSFSPPGRKIRSGIMDQNRSGGFSKSLWHLADQPLSLPTIPPAPTIRRSRIPLSRKQLQPLKESNVFTFLLLPSFFIFTFAIRWLSWVYALGKVRVEWSHSAITSRIN